MLFVPAMSPEKLTAVEVRLSRIAHRGSFVFVRYSDSIEKDSSFISRFDANFEK